MRELRSLGKHLLTVAVIAPVAAAALLLPSSAYAYSCGGTCQAVHYWHTANAPSNYDGTRVTIGNGLGSEQNVASGDFAHSTAYADAFYNANSLIQQGVHWRNHDPYGGSGNCTSNSLEYFVEIIHAGAAECLTEGAANFGYQHVQEVLLGSSGNWRPYMDGYWQAGAETSWSPCGGDACTIATFGEEGNGSVSTTWHSKFAGSGNTEWQFWNGTLWSTINTCSTTLTPGWKGSGPFPGGIWSFIYNDGGTSPYPC